MLSVSDRLKADSHFIDLLFHFKNYFSANIAQKAIGFISLPVMTRLLLPSEYGVVSVFMACVGILVVLLSLNSYTSIGRYWYEKKNDFGEFFGSSFFLVVALLSLSSLVFLLLKKPLSNLLNFRESLLLWLPPFVATSIIGSVFRQVFEPQRKSGLIAKLTVAKAYLSFAASVILVVSMEADRYYGVIWGQLIVAIVVSALMIRHLLPHFRLAFHRKHLSYVLSYSTPLIPYALSGVILAQFDRVMINGYIDSDAAGLYSLAYNIGMLLLLVNGALLSAWTPEYFEDMDNRNFHKLDSDIDKIFRLILIAAMFLMLFGQEVGLALADRKYHVALGIVPVVVVGHIFLGLFHIWGRNIGYARKTIWSPIIGFSAGFTNIALNTIFIPRYGYAAGAYTTVVSYMLMAVMGWAVSRYVVHLHTTPMRIILKPLGMLAASYASILAISTIGWSLWIMLGVKTLVFSVFCPLMIGRYIPSMFRILATNYSR